MVNDQVEKRFDSSAFELEIGSHKLFIRVLKMIGSTMLFISHSGAESLRDMALAMHCGDEVLSTPLRGEIMSESQRLALLLSKHFKIQFFVTFNTKLDKNESKAFESLLFKTMEQNKDKFIQATTTC